MSREQKLLFAVIVIDCISKVNAMKVGKEDYHAALSLMLQERLNIDVGTADSLASFLVDL